MTDTQRKRDPRYTRTVGEKPDLGRRYVENGKVKIEWFEGDKRRSRTIGDNDAKTRRQADEELERLLGLSETERDTDEAAHGPNVEDHLDDDNDLDEECLFVDVSWLLDEFKDRADVVLDFADDLAEAFERGLVSVLDALRRSDEPDDDKAEDADDPDVVDAEVVEEIKDPD